MRIKILATAAFAAAGFVLAPAVAQAQIASFKEDFSTNALPATLEESGPSPIYSGGSVIFPNTGRRYLRTIGNYNNTNFVAELTFTVMSGAGEGNGIGYFGFGAGTADPYSYNEPSTSPTTYVRMAPSDFYGFFGVATDPFGGTQINDGGGDGTYRVRITWNHVSKTFTAAAQKNYTGGTFSPTATIVLTPDNQPFGDTNSRIFFGGAGNNVFDDLRVLALDGTPGAIDCHGQSISGLTRQFGSVVRIVSVLGFASIQDLQNLITGFCGN